ncbi:MAG: nucleotidyltransferase domain-containing protein [Candidatus Margulisbacteria bacterium]|jgi:predicted nucleotidyltransferase|nr:nucleotidyltransferase domain-containing protein [Candidatus Margulisiibacteriota bacterium]
MPNKAVLTLFKKLVLAENLGKPEVYLFGSRARQDCTKDSDWDFLVVSDKKLSPRSALDVKNSLCMKFHDVWLYPVDIIIRDKKTFAREKTFLILLRML